MSDKDKELFVDKLLSGEGGETSLESTEEKELSLLWTSLGELEEEERFDDELVSAFQYKLDAYVEGFSSAAKSEQSSASARRRKWSLRLAWGLAACFGVLLLFAGVAQYWARQETRVLNAQLQRTQENLAIALLSQPFAHERLQGVQTASQVRKPGERLQRHLIEALDTDSNLNVRLAAVSAMNSLPREEAVEILLDRLGKEESALVQLEIIRYLLGVTGEGGEADLIEKLDTNPLSPRIKTYLEDRSLAI